MYNGKKIIVSLTSWKERISSVSKTIYMFERQTLVPDLIVINLSSDEFPMREQELPELLLLMLEQLDNVKLNWVKENTKAFKKVIPTIKSFYNEDCWILSVDDDYLYKDDYVEYVVKVAEQSPNRYLTPNVCGKHIHGWCAIYSPSFFKDSKLFKILPSDCDKIVSSDLWITLNLLNNGIKPLVVKGLRNHYIKLHEVAPLHNIYKQIPLRDRYAACYQVFNRIGN